MYDQRIVNTVESLIHTTSNRIKDVQSNLIPFYNKGLIKVVDSYKLNNTEYIPDDEKIQIKNKSKLPHPGEIGKVYLMMEESEDNRIYETFIWNGTEYISTDDVKKTVIRVDDLKLQNTATPQKDRGMFHITMNDAIKNNIVHPFLLFINGKLIKWSNIEIINDLHYSYIIANWVYYPEVETVDIIQMPFNIYYTEDNTPPNSEMTEIFRFTQDGMFDDAGEIIIAYNVPDIKMETFMENGSSLKGYDIMNIDNTIKLFPENFIIFKEGLLHSSANILVDPMNVVTIDDGKIDGFVHGFVFYDKCSNLPNNNVYKFSNSDYISSLFTDVQISEDEDVPYYITRLREEFNFDFTNTKSYDENIVDSVKYIYNYNPQLLYPAHTSPIVVRSWTGDQINDLVDENGNVVMLRDKYNGHDTYVIPFLNGELYKYHDQIMYGLTTFALPVYEELTSEDILEILYFKNIDNATIVGHVTKEDPTVSLDGYIERDDLLVYADRHHDMKFPTIGFNSRLAYRIDYLWDEDTNEMTFEDDYYYTSDLSFVSKNRFVYIGYNLRKKCFKFQLSDHFKYCDNQKQFMVFINGRKLSQDEFNITILKNTRPFDDLFIYTAKALNPGDKLDVFYVPYPIEGMYMYKSVDNYITKVSTEADVLVYDIPIPYKSFFSDGGTFILRSGNRDFAIDELSYTIDEQNNTIVFEEGSVLPEKLVFIMIYPKGKGFGESGYIYLNKDKLPAPFCKELYMLFVNGKKIPNEYIHNISSDCVRVTVDVQSTYDISVMMYKDILTDLVGLMNTNESSIDNLVNSITEDELNRLNNTYNTITDSEEQFVIDAQKISIINEIVRDFWMRPGINTGVPFLYDYDTDAFVEKDEGGNWIIPAMDATQFINIIEEESDDIVYDLELPHPDEDPYYTINTLNE